MKYSSTSVLTILTPRYKIMSKKFEKSALLDFFLHFLGAIILYLTPKILFCNALYFQFWLTFAPSLYACVLTRLMN